jgi:hypothetical protein
MMVRITSPWVNILTQDLPNMMQFSTTTFDMMDNIKCVSGTHFGKYHSHSVNKEGSGRVAVT